MKTCPYCKKELTDTAIRCLYCRKVLPGKNTVKHPSIFSIEFVKSIFNTWKLIVFKPKKFFDTLTKNVMHTGPVIFVMVIMTIVAFIKIIEEIIFNSQKMDPLLTLIVFVSTPFMALLGIYIFANILQFSAQKFKGEGDFGSSFKIGTYSRAAAAIFIVIPVIGKLVALIVGWITMFFGIKALHKLDTRKSILVLVCADLIVLAFIAAILIAVMLLALLNRRG